MVGFKGTGKSALCMVGCVDLQNGVLHVEVEYIYPSLHPILLYRLWNFFWSYLKAWFETGEKRSSF